LFVIYRYFQKLS